MKAMLKRYRFILLFALAFLGFLLLLWQLLGAEGERAGRQNANISVVMYGDTADRWTSLEQGISHACAALGIRTPTITVSGQNNPEAQIEQLQREIDAGAQGLLVAASDSAALEEYLLGQTFQIPVVMVETGAGISLPVVQADNAGMARGLAARLPLDNTVVLLVQNSQRQSVRERAAAFQAAMQEFGTQDTIVWDNISGQLALRLNTYDDVTLVALDAETLETAIDAVELTTANVALYGIGGSDKIVYALDRGLVQEICVANEFNVGYIGITELAAQLGIAANHGNDEVEYYFVSKQNLYDPEIERLLFPIIQ